MEWCRSARSKGAPVIGEGFLGLSSAGTVQKEGLARRGGTRHREPSSAEQDLNL